MLCLRARLPRQSADSLRRTRIQGFAHKLPCRRQKKHALHALRRSAALKGSCAKVFPALCREGWAYMPRSFKGFSNKAYDATPLPLRFAPQKRTLPLRQYAILSWRGYPCVAFRRERPSDSVGTKTTRSKEKGRTRRPLWPTRRDSNPKQCRRRASFYPIRLRIDILPVYCSTLRRVWQ